MASKFPARNYYQVEYEYGLWWETSGTGAVFPTSPYLMVSGLGDLSSGTEYARSAIQFKTSAPAWASIGDITEKNAILFLFCASNATSSGVQGIQVASISDPWDMSSTATTMRGLSIGAWSGVISSYPTWLDQGWMAFPLESASSLLRGTYGIMLRCNIFLTEVSAYRFLKDPMPFGRAYLQLDITDSVHASATERPDISADTLAAMAQGQGHYKLEASVDLSHLFPAESDIDITIGQGRNLTIASQEAKFPESWTLDAPVRGSLTASKSQVDLMDYRGYLIEVLAKHQIGQRPWVTIGKQQSIIGAVERSDAAQDVQLGDTLYEALTMKPYYRDPWIGFESVEVDNVRVYALLMVLINGGGIPWSRFRQADLVWLMRRFGVVWDSITESTSDMEDFTVASFVEQYAREYALCFSRGNDDCINVWHPAVYRPSMQVWSLNRRNLKDVRYKVVAPMEYYDRVVVGAINPGQSNGDVAMSVQIDGRDKPYPVSPLSGSFSEEVVKYALARQLAHRLVQRHELYTFKAGPRVTGCEVGDKLRITDEIEGFTDRVFTLILKKGAIVTGAYQCVAIRWPDTPAFQSTWQDTGLKGIYRLADWDTGFASGANHSPIGNGGALTINTLNGLSYIDWRGPVANVDLTAPDPWFPSFTNYDLADFVLAIYGDQDSDPYGGGGPDETYTILMKCQDSTPSDEAVVVYIKRVRQPNGSGGFYYPTTDLRIGIGHTLDYLNDPISWEDHIESAPGFSTGSAEWIYGIAVQWHDTLARLYIDRVFIGEIHVPNELLTDVTFTTPVAAQHKIGCIRWLQNSSDWFDTDRMVGKPGIDNYYP